MKNARDLEKHGVALGMKLESRRDLLRRTGAAAITAAMSWAGPRELLANADAEQTLKAAAARVGLRFGSDSDVQFAKAPPEYAKLFLRHCELYSPNLSWATVTPERGTKDPCREESNVEFARRHELKLTGFHLLWHERTPKWVETLESADEMAKAITEHVEAMARAHGGQVYSWNAVNEALHPSEGRSDNLRRQAVYEKMGLDAIDHTFHAAQAALPGAIRVYNDYGFEMNTREQETKRHALLTLIDELKRRNTPIDAIGLQCHMRLDNSEFNQTIYRRFLGDIASRDLKIFITELDVFDDDTKSDVAVRDRAIADVYSRFLDTALDEPAVKTLVTWGLCDKYTWLTAESGPHFARSDGTPTRPLPFDETLKPKPAYVAMLKAIANAPKRPA